MPFALAIISQPGGFVPTDLDLDLSDDDLRNLPLESPSRVRKPLVWTSSSWSRPCGTCTHRRISTQVSRNPVELWKTSYRSPCARIRSPGNHHGCKKNQILHGLRPRSINPPHPCTRRCPRSHMWFVPDILRDCFEREEENGLCDGTNRKRIYAVWKRSQTDWNLRTRRNLPSEAILNVSPNKSLFYVCQPTYSTVIV